MLTSVRWLKEYVDIPWSPKVLADRLTMSGSKVEAITALGGKLSGVRAGRIVEAAPHHESGSLWICQVDVGDRTVQSVCGAPNARAGLIVPVALPGAVLPGPGGQVVESEIKGVKSQAVLCSERELGVSDDHSGLMALTGDLAPGDDIVEALRLDDVVIEFEISPNRPDCLSVVGLAREVAAISEGNLRFPDTTVAESGPPVDELAGVRVEASERCPRYMARVIQGVSVGPSPLWLQACVRAAGMRPINNVVDVTNFVMMELGQPLHAFDLAKLSGSQIVVRMARSGETIVTLDGEERALTDDDLLICDAERPVAVAGVMGGLNSEVGPETTDILLESASFEPTGVRRAARRLAMRTEASHRFEKDIDPHLAALALDRAANLLAALTGGRVATGRIDVNEGLPKPRVIRVRPKRVNDMLGADSSAEMKRILKGLEFGVELDSGVESMSVTVPTFRRDVEGEADIVEEIARIYGFDRIEPTLPTGASVQGKLSWPLPLVETIRDRLVALGFMESVTYSFISEKGFDRLQLPDGHPWRNVIQLRNPLSEEQSVMRTSLIPSLLSAAAVNARRRQDDVRLFEVGKVYLAHKLPLEALPDERWTLAMVMSGASPVQVWGERPRSVDFYDLKGSLEQALESIGATAEWAPDEQPYLHPGRTAAITVGGKRIGTIGEVHPKTAEAYDLRARTYVCEVDLEPLFEGPAPLTQFTSLPRCPAVDRDFALLVPKEVPAAKVVRLIEANGGDNLRSVSLFDVYEGKQIPEGVRSLAYKVTFQAEDRTLTDDEIAKVQDRLREKLKEELGVELRG